ncbi:MAG: PilZ domain-containing protein [Candidatus Sulfotelmatobacter sp.]
MSDPTTKEAVDWTTLLADPDLAQNVGRLLQTYRDAAPEDRDEALLAAMREIKGKSEAGPTPAEKDFGSLPSPRPSAAASTPPFEPDLFTPNPSQDRRRHPRIRCFVAVELRVDNSEKPIWGNLSNTSMGGCQVETASHIGNGEKVEIGLWVASGKIWVKGFALNGVVIRSAPATGVRIRFAAMDAAEKHSLRQFLKYVQETTKAANSENTYLQLLKR